MAELKDIRKKFVDLSGRTDLVVDTTSYEDAGADWFIQAGQRFLDSLLDVEAAISSYVITTQVGEWFRDLVNVKAILNVRVARQDQRTMYLKRQSVKQVIERLGHSDSSIAVASRNLPSYYAIDQAPQTGMEVIRDGKGEIIPDGAGDPQPISSHGAVKRLVWFPPADQSYDLHLRILPMSTKLDHNYAFSFWSLEYPDLLVKAALRELEIFYNNFEGAKNWEGPVREGVMGINFDKVSEEIAEVDRMEDSW